MDDGSKQPHSFGSGNQRGHHTRPFFFVQPPSQPYYLFQHWQLNNPYSHYGLPGGFNFGRPCMHPYPYMPYPGFVLPHAPVYPMDYRRMFEPRFHGPAWGDAPRQQPQNPQAHRRRETACSEAQTDPSDAISKLIECLDKIRASELQGGDRELDSGVASQSFSIFSPLEEKKNQERGHTTPLVSPDSCLESPAVTLSDSTAAVYDSESSQVILEPLSPQGCCSGGLEEELPLDSSSVHEEYPQLERSASDEHFLPLEEEEEVTDIQSNISVIEDQGVPRDAEDLSKTPQSPSCQPTPKETKEHERPSCDGAKADQSCRILKLPFDGVVTPAAAEAGALSSASAPYYYNYLSMQTTHERMSVLSPSLDELSSRDEMFSTDLDDLDLFPKRVYAGRRLSDVISGSPPADEDVEEVWLPDLKSFVCACCGKSLTKGAGRSKASGSKVYWDEAGDSEEDGRYGRGCEQPVRVVVRKHSAPRKAHALPQRHAVKHWHKRGQYKESSEPAEHEVGRDVCKQRPAEGDPAELDSSELQCRTCLDRLCRETPTTEDQNRWADGDVIPRRRPAAPPQRQEMCAQRKQMFHRPRDETHDEPPPSQWERGSAVRGEPRC